MTRMGARHGASPGGAHGVRHALATRDEEGVMPRLCAATYDLCQWPAERLGLGKLRRRAVGDLAGRVLELGAGTGLNFPHYRAAAEVVAVEPDPRMRQRAARRARAARVPIHLVGAHAEALPFGAGSFDA